MNDSFVVKRWDEFSAGIRGQLEKGAKTHGEKSLGMCVEQLNRERDEELWDVVGWTFLKWCLLKSTSPQEPYRPIEPDWFNDCRCC